MRPTSTSESSEAQPSPTFDPELTDVATLEQPSQPLVVMDFRTWLPAVPPGFGEVANHLIFYSNRSGKHQLYQIDLDGSGLLQLTLNPDRDAYNLSPAWSSDGKIAFTSTHVDNRWEIFLLHPDNPSPTMLTDWGADCSSLDWSPDGNSLAFVSNITGDNEVYLINIDSNTLTNLTQRPDADDFLPVWSPDGQHIAFVSDREGDQDIFRMAPDGSGVIRLTEAEGRDTSPDWSPDGSKIAFVSEREGNFEIYVINSDGSNLVRLTNNQVYEWSPTWSPDGKWIAFTSTRDDIETYNLYLMAADGSDQTRLTTDPANDIIPLWWP